MKISARTTAYQILYRIFADKAYTNLALKQELGRIDTEGLKLEERDRALCTEIVYGTVQRQRTLDLLIQPHSKRKLLDLSMPVLTILRMTVYQLAFLDKIPGYAAIHEAVELAKTHEARASGFVNGVLRAYGRMGVVTAKRLVALEGHAKNFAEKLAIRYSFSTWFVARLLDSYGEVRTEHILNSFNDRGQMSVRVNTRVTSVPDMVRAFNQDYGSSTAVPSVVSGAGIRVLRGMNIEQSPLYLSGMFTVQDESAMLVSPLLLPTLHTKILDMCAAPGTKTTHVAELQADNGHITACDIHMHKLKLIRLACARLGLTSIEAKLADARILAENKEMLGAFDAVLLDAPCSGFGVLRHRPDIRYKRRPADIESLAKIQRELLLTAVQFVRSGGIIVYSTCTILPEENEQLVNEVICASDGQLLWDSIKQDLPEVVWPYVTEHGLTLTPELFGTDGFYMARMRKR